MRLVAAIVLVGAVFTCLLYTHTHTHTHARTGARPVSAGVRFRGGGASLVVDHHSGQAARGRFRSNTRMGECFFVLLQPFSLDSFACLALHATPQDGRETMTIEPEHGPAPYLHTLPHTNVPVADLWAVNDWIKNTEVRSLTAEGRGVGVVRLRDRGVSAEWETVFVLVLSSQILSPWFACRWRDLPPKWMASSLTTRPSRSRWRLPHKRRN